MTDCPIEIETIQINSPSRYMGWFCDKCNTANTGEHRAAPKCIKCGAPGYDGPRCKYCKAPIDDDVNGFCKRADDACWKAWIEEQRNRKG